MSNARSSAPAAVAALRLAEVDVAGQLADAEDVEAVADDVGPQRALGGQRLAEPAGPQVAKQVEMFAQRQERGPLRLCDRRQRFPFRSADRAEEDGVARLADLQRFGRQRRAVPVDGRAADVGVSIAEAIARTAVARRRAF